MNLDIIIASVLAGICLKIIWDWIKPKRFNSNDGGGGGGNGIRRTDIDKILKIDFNVTEIRAELKEHTVLLQKILEELQKKER